MPIIKLFVYRNSLLLIAFALETLRADLSIGTKHDQNFLKSEHGCFIVSSSSLILGYNYSAIIRILELSSTIFISDLLM